MHGKINPVAHGQTLQPAPERRSLVIQAILYGNDPADIVRSAEATANSVQWATKDGLVSEWSLVIGDSSPSAVLADGDLAAIRRHVEQADGTLRYEFFGENVGHGGGHNRLNPLTESDLLLVLNPDALLAPDTIGALVSVVAGDVAMADGRQIPFEHPKEYDAKTFDTSWASGACSMLQRSAFDAVGGFDHDTFFMYCDDVDLSWRIRLAGHRVVHEPAARVFHDKRLSLTADMQAGSAEVYYSAEAAVLLAYKYSRPDIAQSILKTFERDGSETSKRVIAEIENRKREGRMPAPLDPEHKVSEFVKGNYATHRF